MDPKGIVAYLLGIVAGWGWGYWWADARRQIKEANVSTFKVGDRVRVLDGAGAHWRGREGTLAPSGHGYYPWIVTGEAFNDKDDEGLAVLEEEIEHVDCE